MYFVSVVSGVYLFSSVLATGSFLIQDGMSKTPPRMEEFAPDKATGLYPETRGPRKWDLFKTPIEVHGIIKLSERIVSKRSVGVLKRTPRGVDPVLQSKIPGINGHGKIIDLRKLHSSSGSEVQNEHPVQQAGGRVIDLSKAPPSNEHILSRKSQAGPEGHRLIDLSGKEPTVGPYTPLLTAEQPGVHGDSMVLDLSRQMSSSGPQKQLESSDPVEQQGIPGVQENVRTNNQNKQHPSGGHNTLIVSDKPSHGDKAVLHVHITHPSGDTNRKPSNGSSVSSGTLVQDGSWLIDLSKPEASKGHGTQAERQWEHITVDLRKPSLHDVPVRIKLEQQGSGTPSVPTNPPRDHEERTGTRVLIHRGGGTPSVPTNPPRDRDERTRDRVLLDLTNPHRATGPSREPANTVLLSSGNTPAGEGRRWMIDLNYPLTL